MRDTKKLLEIAKLKAKLKRLMMKSNSCPINLLDFIVKEDFKNTEHDINKVS